ncbi:N-acetylneuraminate synthase [Lysinibacillus sp. B2A1]|nr:N-acetylneuraminate synthase [Lysinibacillus sp. B2A1]
MRTYIIAEAGVNHNGSIEMAKELVKVAKEAGADAVKFQTFKAENLVTKTAKQANYQIENLGKPTSQYEMLKKLELKFDEFLALHQYCNKLGIEFLSTPFDVESVDFLLDKLQIAIAKIPSGELTNSPFVYYIARKQKSIILSTGMATIEDIHEALAFIAFGLAKQSDISIERVKAFYETIEAKALLKKYVKILHCTTEYPAPFDSINLRTIKEMEKVFGLTIGLSDHSTGTSIPIGAVALGAQIIEKHFTLDKTLEGPDHAASLEPHELSDMIKGIRQIEQALGTSLKQPTAVELQNRISARKSLVAKKAIIQGDILSEDNLTFKRPGEGISPSKYWAYLGKVSTKDYEEDELIDE